MDLIPPFFFYLFAGLCILAVTLMILMPNPVASALCLVFSLFCMAGLYVLLNAPFVAILQILVYAGAVMVLFVFVIMLLKLEDKDLRDDQVNRSHIIFAVLAALFGCGLGAYFLKVQSTNPVELAANFGSPEPIAQILFADYLLPFELASILILVAVLGVVVLGRKEKA